METENYFHINVTGQIENIEFPISSGNTSYYCRYDIVSGPDWELISGLKSGITQNALSGIENNKIVFNMPIEFTFKSTNPYGCKFSIFIVSILFCLIFMFTSGPQIVFSLYGKNFWGTETSQGYGRIHVPLCGQIRQINVPILIPKCSNMWAAIVSWMTDKNPELRDPKILTDGNKTKSWKNFVVIFCFVLIDLLYLLFLQML